LRYQNSTQLLPAVIYKIIHEVQLLVAMCAHLPMSKNANKPTPLYYISLKPYLVDSKQKHLIFGPPCIHHIHKKIHQLIEVTYNLSTGCVRTQS